jgi:hypothetical protein
MGVQSPLMPTRPACAILLLAASCGGSSASQVARDGGLDAGPPNVRTIGAQGGIVRLPGGEASLSIPPGALDSAFAFTLEVGAQAGSYELTPAGVWFRVAATITLAAPPQDGVYVGLAGGAMSVPLESRRDAEGKLAADITHLAARYSVVPAIPAGTREQAATLVRALLPTLYNPPSVVIGPMRTVKAGEVIDELAAPSHFDGNSDFSSSPISELAPQRYTAPADRWFFWVDPQPTAAFNHDSAWVLVDPLRGTVLEVAAHSWPRLGSEPLPLTLEDRLRSPLKVAPLDAELAQELKPPPAGQPEGVSMTTGAVTRSTAPNMCCRGTKVLIIRTSDEPAFVDSETAVRNYLTNTSPGAGLDPFDITSVRAYDGSDIAAAIDALATQPGMCLCDVLIYVVSHGDEGAFVLQAKAGTPMGEESPQYSHADFVEHLGRICAQRLNVVVESCQSGTIHDIIAKARAKAATVAPDSGTGRLLKPYRCLNATITTAAKKGRSAFRGVAKLDVLFGQPYPMNFTGAWISSLTRSWNKDMGDDWGGAAADAANPTIASGFLYWSSPESKRYTPGEDCCQCCGPPDGGSGVSPPPSDGPVSTPPPDASGTSTQGLAVSPIAAVFRQPVFSTFYSALFTNPAAEPLTVTWSGPDCGTFDPAMATTTSATAGELDMTWMHPHPPCDATTSHANVTVKLVVSSPTASYECTYQGAESGMGAVCIRK